VKVGVMFDDFQVMKVNFA